MFEVACSGVASQGRQCVLVSGVCPVFSPGYRHQQVCASHTSALLLLLSQPVSPLQKLPSSVCLPQPVQPHDLNFPRKSLGGPDWFIPVLCQALGQQERSEQIASMF